MTTKKCSICKKEKTFSNFRIKKDSRYGIDSVCKKCRKQYEKLYRKKNLNKIKSKRENFAIYGTYSHQLTVDEESRLVNDGILLEVRCKYCGKYFKPTNKQVTNRVNALKGIQSGDGYLYCSEGCKNSCSVYKQILYPKDHKPATSREVQPQLRKLVLERDNWTCQKCDRTDTLHCHHIDPVKNNPIESADVDNCITFCVDCHKKVHQQDGCTYNELKC